MSVLFTLDAKQSAIQEQYEKGDTVEDLVFIEGRFDNKKPARFSLTVESLGDLIVGDYGHSVLCKFTSADDALLFEGIEDSAMTTLSSKIDFKSFIKDEKFFVKLPFKNDKYRATIDPSFLPSQPEKSPFTRGAQIDIDFTVSAWANFGNSAAGLFLTYSKVTVDGGKKRTIRKR